MKKTLVFYRGRTPRGEMTGWVMHEFHLEGKLPHVLPRSAKDEWDLCKVFNGELAVRTTPAMAAAGVEAELERIGSLGFISELLDSAELPPLMEPSFCGEMDEVIDFKGVASTSGHAAAVPGTSYLQVKMEEHAPLQYQQTLPPPQMFYPGQYFSLPTVNSGDLNPAIRKYCKAEQFAAPTPSHLARMPAWRSSGGGLGQGRRRRTDPPMLVNAPISLEVPGPRRRQPAPPWPPA